MNRGPALRLAGEWIPLDRIVTVVGRRTLGAASQPDVDLGPRDARRVTSRRHAEVVWEGGAAYLRDLGSVNGTSVNGRPLSGDGRARLKDGDLLSFAGVTARFASAAPWPESLVAEWADSTLRAFAVPELVDPTVVGPRPRPASPSPPPPWWRLLRRWRRRRQKRLTP